MIIIKQKGGRDKYLMSQPLFYLLKVVSLDNFWADTIVPITPGFKSIPTPLSSSRNLSNHSPKHWLQFQLNHILQSLRLLLFELFLSSTPA